MAHTKAKGTSKLGRDSRSKRLGVKVFGGQKILSGEIIVRQRGSKFFLGENTAKGADDTIYSKKDGVVVFTRKRIRRFSGRIHEKPVVSVH
ncbi:MAG: rpmA [Candidatus Berkelbacteria bacterium]|nr:rpmA [Candidatus Berkelbacteria bacterium]